jgi:hypothetical protein
LFVHGKRKNQLNKINKDDHPILFQQNAGVKTVATKFYDEWHGPTGIAYRDGQAAFVEQLLTADLVCVDADGKPLTGTEAENKKVIVTKIIGELEIPSSTLYLWRSQRNVRLTYPKPIQDAALAAKWNLSLPHVRTKYEEMLADPTSPLHGKTPAQLNKLTALEADGVVLKLKTAKRPPSTTSTTKLKGVARFQELIEEAVAYAHDEELDAESELISLFAGVFKLTDKLQVNSGLIRYCMGLAAKESLTAAGFQTWQTVVHQLAQDEQKAANA